VRLLDMFVRRCAEIEHQTVLAERRRVLARRRTVLTSGGAVLPEGNGILPRRRARAGLRAILSSIPSLGRIHLPSVSA